MFWAFFVFFLGGFSVVIIVIVKPLKLEENSVAEDILTEVAPVPHPRSLIDKGEID